jgi:hypothetical protein
VSGDNNRSPQFGARNPIWGRRRRTCRKPDRCDGNAARRPHSERPRHLGREDPGLGGVWPTSPSSAACPPLLVATRAPRLRLALGVTVGVRARRAVVRPQNYCPLLRTALELYAAHRETLIARRRRQRISAPRRARRGLRSMCRKSSSSIARGASSSTNWSAAAIGSSRSTRLSPPRAPARNVIVF